MTQAITKAAQSLLPPSWAVDFGDEKDFGIYAAFEVKGVRFPMRWVPPGEFLMGSSEGDDLGGPYKAKPQHRVRISAGFWIGITPVTQDQWMTLDAKNPSYFNGPRRPVERVSWMDCVRWISKLNQDIDLLEARLPSEAEWEYACRAGVSSIYSFGDVETELTNFGWYEKNSSGRTNDVGSKSANRFGLYDVHGNVLEWCYDGARTYATDSPVDPLGSIERGVDRVVRGGGWINSAQNCRSAYRNAVVPGDRSNFLGFRLVAGQSSWSPEATHRSSSPGVSSEN